MPEKDHHDSTLRAYLIGRNLLTRGPHAPRSWGTALEQVVRIDWRGVRQAADTIWQKERGSARRLLAEGNPDHPLIQQLSRIAELHPSV